MDNGGSFFFLVFSVIGIISLIVVLDKKSKIRRFLIVFSSITVGLSVIATASFMISSHFEQKKRDADMLVREERQQLIDAKNEAALKHLKFDWGIQNFFDNQQRPLLISSDNPLRMSAKIANYSDIHLNKVSIKYEAYDCALDLTDCSVAHEEVLTLSVDIPPGHIKSLSSTLGPKDYPVVIEKNLKILLKIVAVNSNRN